MDQLDGFSKRDASQDRDLKKTINKLNRSVHNKVEDKIGLVNDRMNSFENKMNIFENKMDSFKNKMDS